MQKWRNRSRCLQAADLGGPEGTCYMGSHWCHLANTIEPRMFGGPAKMAGPTEMPFGCGLGGQGIMY